MGTCGGILTRNIYHPSTRLLASGRRRYPNVSRQIANTESAGTLRTMQSTQTLCLHVTADIAGVDLTYESPLTSVGDLLDVFSDLPALFIISYLSRALVSNLADISASKY
jgi:hypothetical protein